MLFCPTCANFLIITLGDEGQNKWSCQTCPYEFPIVRQMTTRQHLKRKEVDDIMGGEDDWKNVDSTESKCPSSAHALLCHSGLTVIHSHSSSASTLSKVREPKGLLHAAPDSFRRRTQ